MGYVDQWFIVSNDKTIFKFTSLKRKTKINHRFDIRLVGLHLIKT